MYAIVCDNNKVYAFNADTKEYESDYLFEAHWDIITSIDVV